MRGMATRGRPTRPPPLPPRTCTGVAPAAMASEMDKGKDTRETVIPGFKFSYSARDARFPLIVGILWSSHSSAGISLAVTCRGRCGVRRGV